MPTVPRITPRVSTEALPGVRQNPNVSDATFGGGEPLQKTVNAAQGLLNTADKIYQAEKKKADDIAIQDLDLQSSLAELDLEQTIKNMKGQEALNAPDVLKESWKKETDRIKENAKNDTQRAAFDRISNARYVSLYGATQKHVDSEIKAYDDQQTMAYVTTAINQAAINYQDDEKSARSMFQIENALLKKSERSGWSKEQTDAELFKSRSSMHTEKLRRAMAEGNLAWADSYAKKFKKEIDQNGTDELASIRTATKKKLDDGHDQILATDALRSTPGTKEYDQSPLTLDEIDEKLRSGVYKRSEYDAMRSNILDLNDDRTIPFDERTGKIFEIVKDFQDLGGEVGKGGAPGSQIDIDRGWFKGDIPREQIQKFRNKVLKNSRYLPRDLQKSFLLNTERALLESQPEKGQMFSGLANSLRAMNAPVGLLVDALSIFKKEMPVPEAAAKVAEIKQRAEVATNPNRSKYVEGKIYTESGVTFKVTGHDIDGEPIVDVIP